MDRCEAGYTIQETTKDITPVNDNVPQISMSQYQPIYGIQWNFSEYGCSCTRQRVAAALCSYVGSRKGTTP